MKKRLAGLLALALAVSVLGGCNKAADSMTNSDLKDMKVTSYVTLGHYSNLTVEVEPVDVTQEEWDELTLAVYQSNVPDEDMIYDRKVENGDTVIIDYVGTKDGVAFDGGTATAQELTIGSGKYIAGFEEGLIGVLPGETVDLNLTFPEDYGVEDLNGAAVVFKVTVNSIYPNLSEMKDSVVAAMGLEGVSNIEEYKQYVYNYLQESAELTYL